MVLECYDNKLNSIKKLDEKEVAHVFVGINGNFLHVEYKDKDGNCHNLECVEVVAKDE